MNFAHQAVTLYIKREMKNAIEVIQEKYIRTVAILI